MSACPTHPELEAALAQFANRQARLQRCQMEIAAHALEKVVVRTAAIARIMQQPAPSGKPHSWSSAESLRDFDPDYRNWKTREMALAHDRGTEETALFCARLRAEYLARTLPPVPVELSWAYSEMPRPRTAEEQDVDARMADR